MKIEKNKIVFVAIILCVVLFIGSYAVLVLGDEEEPTIENNQIPVPELEDGQKEYGSKLEALNELKEEREITVPSVYPEHMIDDKGNFNPDYMEYEKQRIIDSIYNEGRISYSDRSFREPKVKIEPKPLQKDSVFKIAMKEENIAPKEMALEHQLFFASNPMENPEWSNHNTDNQIFVRVDGTQTVRQNYRLEMRLTKDATIGGKELLKNTTIYGFVSFRPNRTILTITNIGYRPVHLAAYDFQDGSEGIYIENSFRAEAAQEVVGDVVDDINIVGVPQVSGVKRIFQRNNRTVKVTVTDNYQLILKPIL